MPTIISEVVQLPNTMGIRFNRKIFFAKGLFWVSYVSGTGMSANYYYKTSADGINWSNEILIRVCQYEYGESSQLQYDVLLDRVSFTVKKDAVIYFRRGTPNSDGTITWDAGWQTVMTASASHADHSHILDTNGYPIVGWSYGLNIPAIDANLSMSITNDGTWSTKSGYPLTLGHGGEFDNRMGTYLLSLPNRDVYVIFIKGDERLSGSKYTQLTNTWSSLTWISTSSIIETYISGNESWVESAVEDNLFNLHIVFQTTDNKLIYMMRDINTETWSAETILATGLGSKASPQLAVDGNNVCVFWIGINEHVYVLRKMNGVWEDEPQDWIDLSVWGVPNSVPIALGNDGKLVVSKYAVNNEIGVAFCTNKDSSYAIRFAKYVVGRYITITAPTLSFDVEILINGEPQNTPFNDIFPFDSEVTLEFALIEPLINDTRDEYWKRFYFVEWGDSITSKQRSIIINDVDTVFELQFIERYLTPYEQDIRDDDIIQMEMPETFGERIWMKWIEDKSANRTKILILTEDETFTGYFGFDLRIASILEGILFDLDSFTGLVETNNFIIGLVIKNNNLVGLVEDKTIVQGYLKEQDEFEVKIGEI